MLLVKVYPLIKEYHVSQIYAGLYDMQSQGIITLKFITRVIHNPHIKPHTLWLEVTDEVDRENFKICFDMADWNNIASIEGLRNCDLYFKRSYFLPVIKELDANLRNKIFPYGLYFACRSENETGYLRRLLLDIPTLKNILESPFSSIKSVVTTSIKLLLSKYNFKSDHILMAAKEFEINPSESAESKVLFQTRVWTQKSCPGINSKELRKLNDSRANIIKVLKDEFNSDFVGGLVPTDFAKEYYPDCLSTQNTDRRSYAKLVRKCLIAINTIGLHDSTPGKLPEYIAASKCILSEPLIYDLPTPLINGKNYFVFRNPNECVQLCKKILEDRNLAQSMRENNFRYYHNEIKPSALIANCLNQCANLTM